jgi:hypothetical protein
MLFENPLFLWAFALLLIPILIHLFHFRRYRKVLFTNVKWLSDIKQDSTSSRAVRKWLVLISRILALSCLILAFAIPTTQEEEVGQLEGQVVIYLDNSLSMEREGKNGPLIEEARSNAISTIRSYPPGTRIGVITNDSRLRFFSAEQAIEHVSEIGVNNLQMEPGLLQRKLVEDGSRTMCYLFSDFQQSVFTEGMDSMELVQVRCIPSYPNERQNISIDSAWFEQPVITAGEISRLNVRLSNRGATGVEGMSVQLKVQDALMGTQTVDLDQGESEVATFDFLSSTSGWSEAVIEIADYPMQFDDQYHVAFETKSSYDVLLLTDDENEAITKLFSGNSIFKLKKEPVDRVDYSSLSSYQLIVIDASNTYSNGLANELKKAAETGTSIATFAPEATAIPAYNEFVGRIGGYAVNKTVSEKVSCSDLWFEHPLFQGVFTSRQRNMNLPEVTRYAQYNYPGKAIIELEDGSPFLIEAAVGQSFLYQLAVSDNPEHSNFSRHALFVPTFHNMVFRHLNPGRLSLTIGSDEVVSLNKDLSTNDLPVLVSAESEDKIYPELTFGYPRRLSARTAINQPGTYKLMIPESDSLIRKVAFNLNREESDPLVMSTEAILSVFSGSEVVSADSPQTLQAKLTQDRSGMAIWKWFVIGALVFVVIEIFLLRLLQG